MQIEQVKRKGRAKDAVIESKDQRWHCRNRVTLVFGSNDVEDLDTYIYHEDKLVFKTVKFHQAKSKAVEEILDNCIDEFYRGHVTQIHTTLLEDKKTVVVEDNGLGFPLDKIKDVYTEFRTGSKFKDEEVDEHGLLYRTLGQNGLGASATCLTSDSFKVRVRHYNSKQEQTVTFEDGALKMKKTPAKNFAGHSGVRVELVLAKEVYKNNVIDVDLLRKRIIDLAYNNPGLIFTFNQERYVYKKGLIELAERIDPEKSCPIGTDHFIYETETESGKKVKGRIDITLALTMDAKSEERERFISFVNSTPTYDGGFHVERVKRLFANAIKDKLERLAKKEKLSLVDNDILTGITFVLGIIMPNPRFESQTKRKLVRDQNLEKALEEFLEKNLTKFINKNKDYLEMVMERAISRQRVQDMKDASKQGKKQKRQRVEKLLDANERKDRSKCTLFICEGDSAIGGLRSSRNKMLQGGIALKGKPMNVAQATIKDVLENQEFCDIMASIGLTLGQPADFAKLRFSKIVFLADSDVDGGHINTLLTNFFFHYWPELFDKGHIQMAKAPLFEVITDQGTIFAETTEELESLKRKGTNIKEIQRNKGLGEMSPEAWKHVVNRKEFTKLTIKDLAESKKMLEICFGKESQLRKELLLDEESLTRERKAAEAKAAREARDAKDQAKASSDKTAAAKAPAKGKLNPPAKTKPGSKKK